MANGTLERKQSNRRDGRVAPSPGSCDNIIEIRPKRTIRIKHMNPKARDEKFEKEMQAYLQYRENAILGTNMPMHMLAQRQKSNLHMRASHSSGPSSENKTQPPHLIHNRDDINSAGTDGSKLDMRVSNQKDNGANKMECTDDRTGIIGSAVRRSGTTSQMQSPALSMKSQSVQSVSGVHVDVTRPSSFIRPLGEISERKESESNTHLNGDIDASSIPHSARSSKKTKGHRPISAKSLKKGPRSVASSDISDKDTSTKFDIESQAHLESPFKDVTLFFIHGVGGSADIWNAQIDFFASLGLEVIAPDLLGHGFSQCPDVPNMYHFNELLADMETIFDKYCKRQNIIIGHSYGCAFAAALGRRRARRVTKMVLISGGAPIPLAPQPGVFSLPVCMLSCIKPCLYNRFERNAFHDTKQSGLSREQAFDVPVYVLSHMMLGQCWLDGDELYHQWLTAPTLLLHGKFDNFVTVQEEEAMERAIHISKLVVIDNASHMVMMEAPDEVNKVMYDFFFQQTHEPHVYDDSRSLMSSAKSTIPAKKFSKSLA